MRCRHFYSSRTAIQRPMQLRSCNPKSSRGTALVNAPRGLRTASWRSRALRTASRTVKGLCGPRVGPLLPLSLVTDGQNPPGAMSEEEDTFILGSTISATISLPGPRGCTVIIGLDGYSKPVYGYAGGFSGRDRNAWMQQNVDDFPDVSGCQLGEAHGVCELPDSEHLPMGLVPTHAPQQALSRISIV